MTQTVHPDLLAEILQYCEAHGLSRSTFGMLVMNDPRFVSDLEQGRELRRATIARVQQGMAKPPKAQAS